MTNNKMTKKNMFTALVKALSVTEFADNEEYIGVSYEDLKAFIEHEVELLSKPRTQSKAQKKKNEADTMAIDLVLSVLAGSEEGMTITELLKSRSEFDGMSNQKMTALLRTACADGKAERKVVKRVARFFAL